MQVYLNCQNRYFDGLLPPDTWDPVRLYNQIRTMNPKRRSSRIKALINLRDEQITKGKLDVGPLPTVDEVIDYFSKPKATEEQISVSVRTKRVYTRRQTATAASSGQSTTDAFTSKKAYNRRPTITVTARLDWSKFHWMLLEFRSSAVSKGYSQTSSEQQYWFK